jgi:hypothetical protein
MRPVIEIVAIEFVDAGAAFIASGAIGLKTNFSGSKKLVTSEMV